MPLTSSVQSCALCWSSLWMSKCKLDQPLPTNLMPIHWEGYSRFQLPPPPLSATLGNRASCSLIKRAPVWCVQSTGLKTEEPGDENTILFPARTHRDWVHWGQDSLDHSQGNCVCVCVKHLGLSRQPSSFFSFSSFTSVLNFSVPAIGLTAMLSGKSDFVFGVK